MNKDDIKNLIEYHKEEYDKRNNIKKEYKKRDNIEWEFIKNEDGLTMVRTPTPEGWLVQTVVYSLDGNRTPSVSLSYVPDPKHEWGNKK